MARTTPAGWLVLGCLLAVACAQPPAALPSPTSVAVVATPTSAPQPTATRAAQPTATVAATPTSAVAQRPANEIIIAPSVGLEGLLAATQRAEQVTKLMAAETGLTVKPFVPADYRDVITRLNNGQIDVAMLDPYFYVVARETVGVEPVYRDAATIRSVVLVRSDSQITSVAELKGKRIGFVSPNSAAGYIYAAAVFKTQGIDPRPISNKDISIEFTATDANAVLELIKEKSKYDAIAVSEEALKDAAVLKAAPDIMSKVRSIHTIENVPGQVIVFRKGLDKANADKLRQALKKLETAQDDKGKTLLSLYGWTSMVEAKDADYASMKEQAQAIGLQIKQEIR